LLVRGARQVATLAGGVRRGAAQADAGVLDAAPWPAGDARGGLSVLAWDGAIVALGAADEVDQAMAGVGIASDACAVVDAAGGLITPGLIDPHTHLVFAGTREREAEQRKRGAGYLEILAGGGGILQTVRATREATDDALVAHGRRWLAEMLRHGVTTIEAKSGYGLDTVTELRLLRVAGALGDEGPIEVVPTFLGAHAVAPEFRGRPDAAEAYLQHVIADQLPAIAEQGIARFCDVFCEHGVFDAHQSRRVLTAGAALGLRPRMHADELRPSGGAELAAEIGAASADHLATPSPAGIEALGVAADDGRPVVATLLPATTLTLMSQHYAPARALVERGVPVALGSDFNPGTSPTANLQLVLAIACLQLKLSAAEALVATTINAARALGLEATHGSIEPGKQADLVVWDVPSLELLPYWLGADLVRAVIKRGTVVLGAG
jgi:imidazolonepropionase